MTSEALALKENLMSEGILDPEGTHHEFVSGMHGRKLDFDKIDDESELYQQWIDVAAGHIEQNFPKLPEVILGVANGTNRVALDVARKFDGRVLGAVSEKDERNSKKLYLSEMAGKLITAMKPEFVVVIEDVGTTGSNSVQVARQALAHGAENVEALTTWQRRPNLERLEQVGINYSSIINTELETYSPDDCEAPGFCAQNWNLIKR
jgi:orotate phosphoribosyltransferase